MAAPILAPDDAPAPIEDPVTFTEVALLFKETGLPEFASPLDRLKRKLQRWAKDDGLRTEGRPGCDAYVSYSDLLEAHARRYPAP